MSGQNTHLKISQQRSDVSLNRVLACAFLLLPLTGCGNGDFGGAADFGSRVRAGIARLKMNVQKPGQGTETQFSSQQAATPEMPRLVQAPVSIDLTTINQLDAASVAHAFLAAVKGGDSNTTASLLTSSAKAALASAELVPDARGDGSAYFHVGTVQFAEFVEGETSAHVDCSWTGAPPLTMVLRQESEGWRVAGFVQHGVREGIFSFESSQTLPK